MTRPAPIMLISNLYLYFTDVFSDAWRRSM